MNAFCNKPQFATCCTTGGFRLYAVYLSTSIIIAMYVSRFHYIIIMMHAMYFQISSLLWIFFDICFWCCTMYVCYIMPVEVNILNGNWVLKFSFSFCSFNSLFRSSWIRFEEGLLACVQCWKHCTNITLYAIFRSVCSFL